MSEYISSPCQVIKEDEQLDVKIPKSSVQIKSGGVVLFKEDGVYEVVVSNNQTSVNVTKTGIALVKGEDQRTQEQKMRQWIPASERLPEPYGQVLRTVKSIGWNGTFSIYVDIGTVCPIDTDVIAWMPIPVPYKAESEET